MPLLNYSSYVKAISLGVANHELFPITEILIGSITDNEHFIQTFNKNEVYNITTKKSSNWCTNSSDIPKNIKKAASLQAFESLILNYFDEFLMPILVNTKEELTYQNLITLIENDTDIQEDNKLALINLYKRNELTEFLCETFIYAILADNKEKNEIEDVIEIKPIDEQIKNTTELDSMLNKLAKKRNLTPPQTIDEMETNYVTELFDAYKDKLGLSEFTKETLDYYPKLKTDFLRQRKNFYSAESIRESARDSFGKHATDEFNKLKEETYDSIVYVHENFYENGFDRLRSVLMHISHVDLKKSLLTRVHGWITVNEKMGFCHMLDLRWVDDNE